MIILFIYDLFVVFSFRCNELQIVLDRIKPINGSVASLYEHVEKHVRPWMKIFDDIENENTNQFQRNISLEKLKQSLEKLLLEHS